MLARVKITPRNPTLERRDAAGRERFASLAWGDFHARWRFARSTIPEEKWGTTRSLLLCGPRADLCVFVKNRLHKNP